MTNLSKPTVSVVIPAYNEAKRLPPVLRHWLELESKLPLKIVEYLVVNDGSTDQTSEIISQMTEPRVRCLDRPRNQGKGAAVKHGALQATGDLILILDADGATDLAELPKLVSALNDQTIVIGSRYVPGSRVTHVQPLSRRLISRGGNWLIQRLLLPGIKDTQCGCKLLTRDAAQELIPKLTRPGFSYDVELLSLARRHGYQIKEVPVTWTHVSGTSVHASVDSLRFLADVWRLSRESRHTG